MPCQGPKGLLDGPGRLPRSETLKPMDPSILSATCGVLVIIPVIERPTSAEWKSQIKPDGALAVYRVTRSSDPAPVRNERQGAKIKICAIEIILRRISNGTKPLV